MLVFGAVWPLHSLRIIVQTAKPYSNLTTQTLQNSAHMLRRLIPTRQRGPHIQPRIPKEARTTCQTQTNLPGFHRPRTSQLKRCRKFTRARLLHIQNQALNPRYPRGFPLAIENHRESKRRSFRFLQLCRGLRTPTLPFLFNRAGC